MKCGFCEKEHQRKRFCSNKCKDDWHNSDRSVASRKLAGVSVAKVCDYCGKVHSRKRFCSDLCKDRWHNRNRFGTPIYRAHLMQADEQDDDDDFDYDTGWDEDGWVGDDSGVTTLS